MTIFYVDPVNGNDANAGNTFELRWKTIGQGATAARIAAGDIIRVMKSPDPVNTGMTATWSNLSTTLTLPAAVTQNIALCNTGSTWTGSTNVTSTIGTVRNEGTGSASLAITAAFTTGLAAYFPTGALDLSGYQQVSFWLAQTAGAAALAGEYYLALCSDAVGKTVVHQIPIPAMNSVSNFLRPVTFNLGSAMSSNINSIAFYCVTDKGAVTFIIDNVLACKASSDPDCLTLSHLIGMNNGIDSWAPIRSINGTTITFGSDTGQGLNVSSSTTGYSGPGGTNVPLYSLLPTERHLSEASVSGTTYGAVNDSGTANNPITISGGWDTTDMSTQTGDTWFSGLCSYGCGISVSSVNYINIERIGFTKFQYGLLINTSTYINYTGPGAVGCTIGLFSNQANASDNLSITADSLSYNGCINAGTQGGGVNFTAAARNLPKSNLYIKTVSSNGGAGLQLGSLVYCKIKADNLWGNNSGALSVTSALGCTLEFGNVNYTAVFSAATFSNVIIDKAYDTIATIVTANNGTKTKENITFNGASSKLIVGTIAGPASYPAILLNNFNDIDLQVTSFSGSNMIKLGQVSGISGTCGGRVSFTGPSLNPNVTIGRLQHYKIGGIETNHRIYDYFGSIYSDTYYVHTATTNATSWQLTPNAFTSSDPLFSLRLPIAKVYVEKNSPVTVSAYFMKQHIESKGGLYIAGNQLTGVSETTVLTNDDISTWQLLSTTFTPTETGVIEVCALAYNSTSRYFWVDDFSVSQ